MMSSKIHVRKKWYVVRNVGNPNLYVDIIVLLSRIIVVDPHIEIPLKTGTGTIIENTDRFPVNSSMRTETLVYVYEIYDKYGK